MVELQDLFDIYYGNSLDLNKLELSDDGINFVSRTSKNNGVSAVVEEVQGMTKMPKGAITVSLGGSVLEAFLQPEDFYTGYHIYCLETKDGIELSDSEKLFYCSCIRANKYKYSYGRQANRTLRSLKVPDITEVPAWVHQLDLTLFNGAEEAASSAVPEKLDIKNWQSFSYDDLFEIERGKGPRKKDLNGSGSTPFVTSSDSNNGYTNFTTWEPIHQGNTIGVNRNGSVGEAFYQPEPFCSTEDVHIFTPKFDGFDQYVGLFMATLIRKEKYRYNYGRKWGIARMKASTIRLPVDQLGNPDCDFMKSYIKSLPFSKSI